MTNANDLSILGNFDITDLADIPEFRTFPAGTHTVNLDIDVGKSKTSQKPMVTVTFTAIETIELSDESETPLRRGENNKVYCMLDNEWGQASLRKIMAPIAEATQISNLADLVTHIKESDGIEVTLVSGTKANKKEPGKIDLVVRQVIAQ